MERDKVTEYSGDIRMVVIGEDALGDSENRKKED